MAKYVVVEELVCHGPNPKVKAFVDGHFKSKKLNKLAWKFVFFLRKNKWINKKFTGPKKWEHTRSVEIKET